MKISNKSILMILFIEIIFLLPLAIFINPIIIENGSNSEQVFQEPVPSAGIDLEIYMPDYQIPGVENVTDDFLASPLGNGVNSVTVKSSGPATDVQLSFLQALMEAGTATATVIGLDVIWTALFADNGWIIELDPYLETNELDDYSPGIVNACKYDGITYAYPYFMNLGALYYRKDLLDLHLPGWTETDFDTWEGLNTTANYILNNEAGLLDDPDLVGYIGQLDAYEGGVVNFFEWCGSNGALNLISNSTVNINTPKVAKAMEFIKALIPPEYAGVQGTDCIIPREALTYNEGLSYNKWISNESIFMRQWTYAYGLSLANNMEFGIAPLPHFQGAAGYKTSCVGGAILAIPTATTGIARKAAVNLTKFLGDVLAQESELTADTDPGPGYIPLSNFPALKSVYSNPPAGFDWIKNWSDQVNLTLSRPVVIKYSQISSAIAISFNELLSCQKSVDVALTELQETIAVILGLVPGSFTLTSDADDPDPDGAFNLIWTTSEGADNYSLYTYHNHITKINQSLTLLANQNATSPYPISGLLNGTYYYVVVAYNESGYRLSDCINVTVQIMLPGSFILTTNADTPDTDGSFSLTWTASSEADNYSLYTYQSYISEINQSLTLLVDQNATSPYSVTGLENGNYYYVIVAYNEFGSRLSNCIKIVVEIEGGENIIPGYNISLFISMISLTGGLIIFWHLKKKN
ncbi:MAG: extracellular solute-binding protein [Promethearchaeota archaeon]